MLLEEDTYETCKTIIVAAAMTAVVTLRWRVVLRRAGRQDQEVHGHRDEADVD